MIMKQEQIPRTQGTVRTWDNTGRDIQDHCKNCVNIITTPRQEHYQRSEQDWQQEITALLNAE